MHIYLAIFLRKGVSASQCTLSPAVAMISALTDSRADSGNATYPSYSLLKGTLTVVRDARGKKKSCVATKCLLFNIIIVST